MRDIPEISQAIHPDVSPELYPTILFNTHRTPRETLFNTCGSYNKLKGFEFTFEVDRLRVRRWPSTGRCLTDRILLM